MSSQSFPQYVIEHFGKSVFQIQVDLAAAYFVAHPDEGADAAWRQAEAFAKEMEHRHAIRRFRGEPA